MEQDVTSKFTGFSNSKMLEGKNYRVLQDKVNDFLFGMYLMLTRRDGINGAYLKNTEESRELGFRGFSFHDIKDEVRRRWPVSAVGLAQRVIGEDEGKVVLYRPGIEGYNEVALYMSHKYKCSPLVVHLSSLNMGLHQNNFLLQGEENTVNSIRNVIDAFSRQRGYSSQEL